MPPFNDTHTISSPLRRLDGSAPPDLTADDPATARVLLSHKQAAMLGAVHKFSHNATTTSTTTQRRVPCTSSSSSNNNLVAQPRTSITDDNNAIIASEASSVTESNNNKLSSFRLSHATLDSLPATVTPPDYDPRKVTPGILHIGTGNFALAHMASYVHDILKFDPTWGIVATSIRSEKTVKALKQQDGLYLLVRRENDTHTVNVMAPVVGTIYGPAQPSAIFNEIAKDNIRMVTLTVTNKGYYLSSGGKLDKKASDIKHDLTTPNHPKTAYGYLAQGLLARYRRGGKPISILSLDNIEENSSTFRKAFMQYMDLYEQLSGEKGIVDWIQKNVDFLVTLVDRITPEPTEEFRHSIHTEIGFESTLTIGCETFRQLVVERGRFETPCWDKAGIQVVDSCGSYWQRKFYCLNAGHMIVAAAGNRLGTPTIHETMAHEPIARLLKMAQDEWCTIIKGEPEELAGYTATIRKRFADPSMNDTVRRVGGRATSKVSDRLLSAVERSLKSNGKLLKVPTFATALYLLNLGLINEKGQKFVQDDMELHKMVSIHEFIMRRLAALPQDRNSLAPAAVQEILEDMSLALGGEPRFTKLSKNRQFVMCLAWSLVAIHRNGLEKAVDMLENYEPDTAASLARAHSSFGTNNVLLVPNATGTNSKRASTTSMQ